MQDADKTTPNVGATTIAMPPQNTKQCQNKPQDAISYESGKLTPVIATPNVAKPTQDNILRR
jgi:hypothetical protein